MVDIITMQGKILSLPFLFFLCLGKKIEIECVVLLSTGSDILISFDFLVTRFTLRSKNSKAHLGFETHSKGKLREEKGRPEPLPFDYGTHHGKQSCG